MYVGMLGGIQAGGQPRGRQGGSPSQAGAGPAARGRQVLEAVTVTALPSSDATLQRLGNRNAVNTFGLGNVRGAGRP